MGPVRVGKRVTRKGHESFLWYLVRTLLHSEQGRREQSLLPSYHIRSIEEHLLPDPRPVYVITVFENFSRAILASAISATQNQFDYLAVLADAIRHYGTPEALVTDGGGQFYSTVALQLYDMLGIRKERIDPGQPWQDYAETLFSIMWNTPAIL